MLTNYIAFDFETSGTSPEYALQPWRIPTGQAWATSIAYAYVVGCNKKLFGYADGAPLSRTVIADMLDLAITNKSTMVGWNVVFDIAILLAYGFREEVMQLQWIDAMLLWKHLEIEPEYEVVRAKKKSFGLKTAVNDMLPMLSGYDENIDFHATDSESVSKLLKYNKIDVVATALLAEKFYAQLEESPLQLQAAMIESKCLPLVADANLRGLLLSRAALTNLSDDLTNAAAKALSELEPYGVTEKVVRSPAQLSKLLFDTWGLPTIKQNTSKKTARTTDSTDKEVLHELSFIDQRAKTLREYREALGNKTKFADKPLESLDYNGGDTSHPQAMVFSTYTGRLTYASTQGKNSGTRQIGFALHQSKRSPKFRDIVQAPEGYTIVEFDAAGQEYRWMALASRDATMLQMCMPGEDAHGYMGAEIAHIPYKELLALRKAGDKSADESRQLGKVANLSCGYRTSAKTLRKVARVGYNLPMDEYEAEHIWRTYRKTYPGVVRYWETQVANVKRCGYAETFAGRRVRVAGNWSGPLGWSMESTAINYRIQGTGADQKYLAIAVLKPYMTKKDILFAWELHDGLYFFVPDKVVDVAVRDMRHLLNNLPYKKAWGYTPDIPLPWDCKVGKTWGQLKEIKEI